MYLNMPNDNNKIIIVEGITDKHHIQKMLTERLTILCTYGTFSIEYFDELLDTYHLFERDVYILVDEDASGLSLRRELSKELSDAHHIHVPEAYKEVAETPAHILAAILVQHNFHIKPFYLQSRN